MYSGQEDLVADTECPKEEMNSNLAFNMVGQMNEVLEATSAATTRAIKSFNGVMAMNAKQFEMFTQMFEKNLLRVSELGVDIMQWRLCR